MTLSILVPVLGRPHRVAPLLASIASVTPGARVIFITDPDDTEERRRIAIAQNYMLGLLKVEMLDSPGTYASKINVGVENATDDFLFFGADDLHFHHGWLDAAQDEVRKNIGVVGTQDLCNGRVREGLHATHFLVTHEYAQQSLIDGGRGPLCELYPHEFVDDEFVATARFRQAWAFSHESIVEHLHPDVGKAPEDVLYSERRVRMRQGRRIFRSRENLWT